MNGTVVTSVSLPVLHKFELIANSETDFYLFDLMIALPRFLSIDSRTGCISGFAATRMDSTKVTVTAQSVTSVVLTELTLEFYVPENGTIMSGEVWGSEGSIRVFSEYV